MIAFKFKNGIEVLILTDAKTKKIMLFASYNGKKINHGSVAFQPDDIVSRLYFLARYKTDIKK